MNENILLSIAMLGIIFPLVRKLEFSAFEILVFSFGLNTAANLFLLK